MKKFIYTLILAVGFQFAQAQKPDTIFLVQQLNGGDVLFRDMKDIKLKNYPLTGVNYEFWVDVQFTNTSGRTLHIEEWIVGGEKLWDADSIRVEIWLNDKHLRYPVKPNDPNYFLPVVRELNVSNGDSLLYVETYIEDIVAGKKGFLGLIPFNYARISMKTGENNPNKLCVRLTHLKTGNIPDTIKKDGELCINFYVILPTFTIKGKFTHEDGSPLANTGITFGNNISATTNALGEYTITVDSNASVTLTPSSPTYTFEPASISCGNVKNNLTGKDFKVLLSGDGIQEITTDNSIRVYPNPASTEITVIFSEQLNNSYKITLFDIYGKDIKSVTNQNIISISELSSGIYFIKVECEDKVVTKKVVKR